MKLKLYIRGHLFVEVELNPPAKEPYMDFEGNCKVREGYVKFMIEALKNKYQKAIENQEWKIYLVVEEKILEPQINLN